MTPEQHADAPCEKRCICAEVYGENPDCLLHGAETDWAVKNTLPQEWQAQVLELRAMLGEVTTTLRAELADAHKAIDGGWKLAELFELRAQLAEVEAERDRMREALRLASHELQASAPFVGAQGAGDVYRAADACLSALKETDHDD